jgi:hypothetical protein
MNHLCTPKVVDPDCDHKSHQCYVPLEYQVVARFMMIQELIQELKNVFKQPKLGPRQIIVFFLSKVAGLS